MHIPYGISNFEELACEDFHYVDRSQYIAIMEQSGDKKIIFLRPRRFGKSLFVSMFSPTVQLRSGGYIVLNQTEALVSIDVNSGRSTREHHIEDTALKTNVEADRKSVV